MKFYNPKEEDLNKFLPCPFCGQSKELDLMDEEHFYRRQGEYGSAFIEIRCDICNAMMRDYTHVVRKYKPRVTLLSMGWNVRRGCKDGKRTE